MERWKIGRRIEFFINIFIFELILIIKVIKFEKNAKDR